MVSSLRDLLPEFHMNRDVGQERIARISTLIDALLARARTAAPESLVHSDREEDWSATQVLGHVVELLPFWARQARLVAARTRDGEPFGRSTVNSEEDPARLEAVRRYQRASLSELETLLQASFARAAADLRAIPPGSWERTGRHANGQARTVRSVVDDLLIRHLEAHVSQLERAIGQHTD